MDRGEYWRRKFPGVPNAERMGEGSIFGVPGPALRTTFAGRTYVLDWSTQNLAVVVVNRQPFRHGVAQRVHANYLLMLADELGVDTYTAGLVALWVAPDRCGIDWGNTARVHILSREEQDVWRAQQVQEGHDEFRRRFGVCMYGGRGGCCTRRAAA